MTQSRLASCSGLMLLLSACTAVPAPGPSLGNPGPPASAFNQSGPLKGADARRLTQMFGTPRLDIRERTMRKLQFANGRCVLDAYLYAPAAGKEPVVTHVDARALTGANVDAASCANALQSR